MDEKLNLKGIFTLFLVSLIYFGIFFSLYATFHAPIFTLFSIALVSYFAWKRGTVSGLVLSGFDMLWTGATFTLLSPDFRAHFPPEAPISGAIHIFFTLLLGYFGKLARQLQNEVNERKNAEAKLKEYQNELEERVRMRTKELELANARLHQAEKMESIGKLAGGIAHDFNNYLQIILGYSALIVHETAGNSREHDHAKRISKTAEDASKLTMQLLTFARKEQFKIQPIKINDLIQDLVSLLSGSLTKRISIEFSPQPELPPIQGGTTQIQNALLNLAVNARDAMEKGGTLTFTTNKIEVTADACDEHGLTCQPGTYVSVSVADTGTGIPPDVFDRIFEPFFTTKEEGKGTGMGLAAVYGIARSHQGAVYATTQLGKGTTFTMLFPVMMES